MVWWVAISDRWLTDASSQMERHLATKADVVCHLLLKRKRVPSPGGTHGKSLCSHIRGDICAIKLTRSQVRQALHHTVQLDGSPIRWEDVGPRDE